jgi:hypothetical protein
MLAQLECKQQAWRDSEEQREAIELQYASLWEQYELLEKRLGGLSLNPHLLSISRESD